MTSSSVATLVLIALAAVLAPILSELTGPLAVPEIVIQIMLGILVGPYLLGIAHVSTVVTGLSDLGLTFLIFLAGYELDLQRIRGQPLRLAPPGGPSPWPSVSPPHSPWSPRAWSVTPWWSAWP